MIGIIDYYSIDPTSFRYLSHYGISGQQWGIRQFQNKDGTLKENGKGRYQSYAMPRKWLGKVMPDDNYKHFRRISKKHLKKSLKELD